MPTTRWGTNWRQATLAAIKSARAVAPGGKLGDNLEGQRIPARVWALFCLVLLGAAFVRLAPLGKGLPYTYFPDEPNYVRIVQRIFLGGGLSTHFYLYPSLFFYINALAYIPFYLMGVLLGRIHNPGGILPPEQFLLGVGYTPQPSTFLLGRGVSALFGLASIWLLFIITRRLTGSWKAALLGALLLGLAPIHVEHSRLMFPHVLLVFFLSMSLYASLQVLQRGQLRDYVLAGLACGGAVSTMYHGGLGLVLLATAHFLRPGKAGIRDGRLYLAVGATVASFILLNLAGILSWTEFARDVRFIFLHYGLAIGGNEMAGIGGALAYYITHSWRVGGPLLILAAFDLVRTLVTRDRAALLGHGFAVVYFVIISSAAARNTRTFLPITPFLILSSVSFFSWAFRQAEAWGKGRRLTGLAAKCSLAALGLALIMVPGSRTLTTTANALTVDSRETARLWVIGNIPPGSKIAIEAYSPFVDPERYVVVGVVRMIDNSPGGYVANGFDYLVFSQGMYRRFFTEPDTYPSEVAAYEALFHQFEQVRLFADGGYEIRVYQVAP